MQAMPNNMQLLVITHLPQVASKGNHQLKVYKEVIKDTTKTNVVQLTSNERLKEIAQMIFGTDISDAALHQAKELLNL